METKDQKTTAIAVTEPKDVAQPATFSFELDVQRVVAMRAAVERIVREVLREGEHCGIIPGTKKKSLLQPGAEVLCQVFRMRPEYEEIALIERDDFLAIKIKCKLFNAATGELVGEAIGSANSREEKYVSQTTMRLCPNCGKPAIIKGSKDYGGGWVCWLKKDGCGAKFDDNDKRMIQDQGGNINTQKVWGLYHTLESIAQKRAYVRATRTATGTSDIFTDEPEDEEGSGGEAPQAGRQPATQAAPKSETVKYVDAISLRDLSWAIRDSKLAEVTVSDPAKRDEAYRARRLEWINRMLDSVGQQTVAEAAKLTEAQAKILIELAKKGAKPEGWA